MELKDWGTPTFPTDTDTMEPSDQPAGFELKPAGPEKESWLGNPGLQHSDDYHELTSNGWNHKRSGNAPSMSGMPTLLTHELVQDPEPLLGAQQLDGEYRLASSQKFPLGISILLSTAVLSVVGMVAIVKIKKKIRRRMMV